MELRLFADARRPLNEMSLCDEYISSRLEMSSPCLGVMLDFEKGDLTKLGKEAGKNGRNAARG